ncbi:MAG: AMP-binding protein [Dehalococcoidales bacterium]|nr:AMP-binding protein [Dehalococcoidales bacterium]
MEKKWYTVWDKGTPKTFQPKKSVPEYFKDNVISGPDKIAVSFYGFDMTYKELDEAVDRFAAGLLELGVEKGDRVGLYLANCPQFVISFLGTLRAGGIVVALNSMFKQAELEYEINDSGAETLVTLDYLYPEVGKIKDRVKLENIIVASLWDYMPEKPVLPLPPEMNEPKTTFPETIDFIQFLRESPRQAEFEPIGLNDIAILQYTGGTTGLPKGAMGTHYALTHNTVGSSQWFRYNMDDIHMAVLPLFHVLGLIAVMGQTLVTGGRMVIMVRFNPETLARAVEYYKPTVWVTSTTMVIAMLDWPDIDKHDFSSLRITWFGGALMPGEVLRRLQQLLPNATLGEGYGLSENFTSGGAVTPVNRPKPGFIGIPHISVDMKIMDLATGTKEVAPGEEGEIITKGPGQMKGYWLNPEATEKTIRDGWLYTGDIGMMDEEGYLKVIGRTKELIKCSGFSVFPSEVEELLYKHPGVMENVVIGIADSYRGETIKAFIVLKPEFKGKISEAEIIEWAKDNMATYKRPRIVEFRDELPKSGAGKILRRVLAEEDKRKQAKS